MVHLGLFGGAYEWAHELDLERVKWKEFVCLFRERFIGDRTPWAGIIILFVKASVIFNYHLYLWR